MHVSKLKAVFESIDKVATKEEDDQALSVGAGGPLDPAKLETVDAHGQPYARLYRSKTASCQGGRFLMQSSHTKLTKADHFAYIPCDVGDADDNGTASGDPPWVGHTTVLKVTDIYSWHQAGEAGEQQIFRFAIGTMSMLIPQGRHDDGYELDYRDGCSGGRARRPTLLKKKMGQRNSYVYGVWLHQIDCTMVSTRDEQWFIPTQNCVLSDRSQQCTHNRCNEVVPVRNTVEKGRFQEGV